MASRCPFSGAGGSEPGAGWSLRGIASAAMRRLGGAMARCPVTGATAPAPEPAPSPEPAEPLGPVRLAGEARELIDILTGEGALSPEVGARRLVEIEAEIAATGPGPAEALDELTGLRRPAALPAALAGLGRSGGTVAVFDLDEFAQLNSAHGPKVGDQVLRAIGRAVLAVLGPEDVAVRNSGDEMTVVLPGVDDPREAANVAQRVRAAVGAIRLAEAPRVTVRASMGIATCRPGEDPVAALRLAQDGVERAKIEGRDCAVLMEEAAVEGVGRLVAA